MTKRRLILWLSFACTACLLATSGVVSAATTTQRAKFTQKILPLTCVYQEVNDGLGTLIYLTPADCGIIDKPGNSGGGGGRGNSGGSKSPSPGNNPLSNLGSSGLVTGQYVNPSKPKTLHLNHFQSAENDKGLAITVSAGFQLAYIPLFGADNGPRTIVVTATSPQWVTLVIQPLGQLVDVKAGEKVLVDYSSDQKPRLAIRLLEVPKNGQAKLKIWLLNARPSAIKKDVSSQGVNELIIVGGAVAIVATSSYMIRSRIEKRYLSRQ